MSSSKASFLNVQSADLSGDDDWLAGLRLGCLLVLALFGRLLVSFALEMFSPISSFLSADDCDISVQIAILKRSRLLEGKQTVRWMINWRTANGWCTRVLLIARLVRHPKSRVSQVQQLGGTMEWNDNFTFLCLQAKRLWKQTSLIRPDKWWKKFLYDDDKARDSD